MIKDEFQMMALNIIRDAKSRSKSANTQEERKMIVQKMGLELEELRNAWDKMAQSDTTMLSFMKEFQIPEFKG
jgi:hypothetical protein